MLVKIAQELQDTEERMTRPEKQLMKQRVKKLTTEMTPLPDFSRFHRKFRPNPDTPAGDLRSAFYLSSEEDSYEYMRIDGALVVSDAIMAGREVVFGQLHHPVPARFPDFGAGPGHYGGYSDLP